MRMRQKLKSGLQGNFGLESDVAGSFFVVTGYGLIFGMSDMA